MRRKRSLKSAAGEFFLSTTSPTNEKLNDFSHYNDKKIHHFQAKLFFQTPLRITEGLPRPRPSRSVTERLSPVRHAKKSDGVWKARLTQSKFKKLNFEKWQKNFFGG